MTQANRPVLKQKTPPEGQNPDPKEITAPDFHEVQNRVLAVLIDLGEAAERTGGERLPKFRVLNEGVSIMGHDSRPRRSFTQ
jgi:hypothetical protein